MYLGGIWLLLWRLTLLLPQMFLYTLIPLPDLHVILLSGLLLPSISRSTFPLSYMSWTPFFFYYSKITTELDMVVDTCNPSPQVAEAGGLL